MGRTIAEINLDPVRIEPSVIDLGAIEIGLENTRVILISNRSSEAVVLDAPPRGVPGVTLDIPFPVTIPANEAIEVPVSLRGAATGPWSTAFHVCLGTRAYQVGVRATVDTGIRNTNAFPRDGEIVHRFVADIDPTSVNPTTFVVHGAFTGRLEGDYAVVGREVHFQPRYAMKPGERVSVSLTGGIRYAEDGASIPPQVFEFRAATGTNEASGADVGRFVKAQRSMRVSRGSIALGDLDGDGDVDVLVLGGVHCDVGVWRNEAGSEIVSSAGSTAGSAAGAGAGASGSSGPAFEPTLDVALEVVFDPVAARCSAEARLGDLDMDGDLDALVWRSDTGPVVLINDGSGHFAPSGSSVALPPNGGRGRTGWTLGDLDQDGDLDAVRAFSDGVYWFVNESESENEIENGRGHLGNVRLLSGSIFGDAVVLADWDRDGDLDLWGSSRWEWLRNDTSEAFVSMRASTLVSRGAESGDVDGDGLLDFVFPEARGGGREYLGVLVNRTEDPSGPGTLTQNNTPLDPGSVASLGDLDGDGDLDAVIGSFVLENRLNEASPLRGGWSEVQAELPANTSLADLDGDGDLDIIAPVYIPGDQDHVALQVWLNE